MLEAIRKGASSWVVKLLILVPLILAFAVWGIEDMIRGYSQGTLASVGERKITAEEFQTNYNYQLNAISQRLGRRLTPQQAQSIGLPDQVMTRLLGTAAVDEHVKKLNLAMSQDVLVSEVQKDPAFVDGSGAFNRLALDRFLSQVGMSERQFLEERRRDVLRDHITGSMLNSVYLPKTLVDAANRYQNEERKLAYLELSAGKPEDVAAPEDKVLEEFYAARKADFQTPELRKIALLQVTAEDVRKSLVVPEADIKQLYDSKKATYDTPERRKIQQIPFPDAATATAALKEITEGKDFLEVAKAAGAKETDIELGTLTKAEMIDSKVAEAAFKAEKDKPVVVAGDFSTVLLRVTEIEAGTTKTLEDVRQQVRDELADQRVAAEVQRLHDLVDELKLAGKSPGDIAAELKVSFQEFAAVDRQGRDGDGKTVMTDSEATRLLQAAFAGLVGVESEPTERADGGYAWVDVLAITPSKQKEFAAVKDEVLAAWRARQVEDALRATAQGYVDRLGKGEHLADMAKAANIELKETGAFKRTATVEGLPRSVIAQAFTLPVGGGSAAPAADAGKRIVFEVREIIPAAALEPAAREQLVAALRQQSQADIAQQYLSKLQSDFGATVNRVELNRVLGIEEP